MINAENNKAKLSFIEFICQIFSSGKQVHGATMKRNSINIFT